MKRSIILALALIACAAPAHAQEVIGTSRSLGMGDAMTAGSGGSAALFHNPAGIASAIIYIAEAGYAFDSRTGAHGVSAYLLDMKSNPHFGMGLAFTYETGNLEGEAERSAYHIRGGLGVPLVDGLLKLGASVRYSAVELDGEEVLAALMVDAGVIVQPIDWLSFGVTGLNLINGGYDQELPMTIGLGFAFHSLEYGFHISGDLLFDISAEDPAAARTWRAGAEYLIEGAVPLRMGFLHDELLGESSISAGLGFRDMESSIGLDAGYRHNLDNEDDKVFNASFSFYF